MARTPFEPDLFFSRLTNVHFGSAWLAIRAVLSPASGSDPQIYTLTLDQWNPSAPGMQSMTMLDNNGNGGSNQQSGAAPTAEQNAQYVLNYSPVLLSSAYRGIVLVNMDKLSSVFPNPTFQFDFTLTYNKSDQDPDLTNMGVEVELGDSPRVRNGLPNFQGPLFAFNSQSSIIDFTGQELLWKVRIFVDMESRARDWANAITAQQLFP